MKLVLDFTSALRTDEDDLVGVVARVADRVTRITIAADAILVEDRRGDGVSVGRPDICAHQAWLAAVAVSGNTLATPIGDGDWDEASRTLSWSLRSGRRRIMA